MILYQCCIVHLVTRLIYELTWIFQITFNDVHSRFEFSSFTFGFVTNMMSSWSNIFQILTIKGMLVLTLMDNSTHHCVINTDLIFGYCSIYLPWFLNPSQSKLYNISNTNKDYTRRYYQGIFLLILDGVIWY